VGFAARHQPGIVINAELTFDRRTLLAGSPAPGSEWTAVSLLGWHVRSWRSSTRSDTLGRGPAPGATVSEGRAVQGETATSARPQVQQALRQVGLST
jgi:hypothetical protein